MCEFLKICWDIFKNFSVENLFYWIIGNVEIVEIIEKFWNYGIHLHHGCVKKGQKLWKLYEMEKERKKKWNCDEN